MNPSQLTESEKLAALDLTLLAMYADGHLAGAEDGRVVRLLDDLGFGSGSEQTRAYDAGVARVRRSATTPGQLQTLAVELAGRFTTRESRLWIQGVLDGMITSDRHVSLAENELMTVIRDALEK